MYEQSIKFGQSIIVCGSRPCLGTSTTAAMIASELASNGDQTLLLSTDYNHPYDAVSLLSDIITDNFMDELIALENSNGLTPTNFKDYAGNVSDTLFYMRLSTKMSTITRDTAKTLEHILDTSNRVYRYTVLDLDFSNTMYLHRLSKQAEAVVYLFGQDFQSIKVANALAANDNTVNDHAVMLPVLANRITDIPVDEEVLGKILKTETVMAIEHDPEVFKMAQKRNIAEFMAKNGARASGIKLLFRRQNEEEENPAHASVAEICKVLKEALTSETGGDAS